MNALSGSVSTDLPAPILAGRMSFEEAVFARRCIREFKTQPLASQHIAQLCWAAQGITDPVDGLRATPSAGALYPIELYVVSGDGVDHYRPAGHRLERHLPGDVRRALQRAALDQDMIGEAPMCMVIAAVVKRLARKYGERADRYCFMEAGHIAQNVLLQAAALRLAGVPIGAYEDDDVAAVLKLPKDQRVLYLLTIGFPKT